MNVGTVTGHYKQHSRDVRLTLPSVRRELNGFAAEVGWNAQDALKVANDQGIERFNVIES